MVLGEVGAFIIFSVSLLLFLGIGLSADSSSEDSLMLHWVWIGPVTALVGLFTMLLSDGLLSKSGAALFLFSVPLTVTAFVSPVDLGLLAAYLFPAGFFLGQQLPGEPGRGAGLDAEGLVVPRTAALLASGLVTILVRRKKNE
jgi:hypothetical protein